MKTKTRLCNIALGLMVSVVFCVSSFAQEDIVASNSASSREPFVDYVARFLAQCPPAVKHKDWMQIEPLVSMAQLDAPFVHLCSAIESNAEVNRFRLTWNAGDYNFSDHYVIAYDRKTKVLWYRVDGVYSDDFFTHYSSEISRIEGVSPSMILASAKISLNSAKDSVINNLVKSGCKLTTHRHKRTEQIKPQK